MRISLLFLIFSILIISCSTSKKASSKKNITQIEYQANVKKLIADSVWQKVRKMPPGIEKNSQMAQFEKLENPAPSFYQLIIKDDVSRTKYKESLSTEENANLKVTTTPFGDKNIYKFQDSTGAYLDFNNLKSEAFLKTPNRNFEWQETNRDSTILGTEVYLVKGTSKDAEIEAWITEEFNSDLGIYDIFYPKGFVLAYKMKSKNNLIFKEEKLNVFPKRIKNTRKDFPTPSLTTEYTKEELTRLFQEKQ